MVVDTLTSLISSAGFPLIGGGLLGVGVRYLLKKLLKLAILVIGGITLLLGYLECQKIISVNWIMVEN
jgi:uncharacterized membrane protein (Fun14 family)